jgi:hypothetical protein
MLPSGAISSLSVIALKDMINRCSFEECQVLQAALQRRQDELKLRQAEIQLKEKLSNLLPATEFHDELHSLRPSIFKDVNNRDFLQYEVTINDDIYVLSR